MAAPGAPGPGPVPGPGTVLMAARAELAAPCRLLPAAGAELRLQLSVEPGGDGRRRFRLGLRLAGPGGAPLALCDLRDVSYRVCGPARHELQLPPLGTAGTALGTPQGTEGTPQGTEGTPQGTEGTEGTVVALRFPEEREAQQWWTVLSSSMREARRVPPLVTSVPPLVPPPSVAAPPEEPEQDPALELAQTEELSLCLARAVALGDAALAAQSAVALSRRRAELSVRPRDRGGDREISLSVSVEDAASSAGVTLRVRPSSTICSLKEQVHRELGFPVPAQRWIIGQSLCRDGRSLGSYGVRGDGDPAFLFLLSRREQSREQNREHREQNREHREYREQSREQNREQNREHREPNREHREPNREHREHREQNREQSREQRLLEALGLTDSSPGAGPVPEPLEQMDLGDLGDLGDLEDLGDLGDLGDLADLGDLGDLGDLRDLGDRLDSLQFWDSAGTPPTAPEPRPPSPEQGWPCPRCTFLNKPTRPGCEMCSAPRPHGYRVPGGHRPDPGERRRLHRERHGARQCRQALEQERLQNFQRLLRAERAGLVPNAEPLECGICLQGAPSGSGVVLRECLHGFCRECLRQLIQHSEEPLVPCPYRDATYACDSHLQEREIRALLSPEEHARFLARGLALAERRSRDSFHCRGRDCPGWGWGAAEAGEFRCPVCGASNCLRCQAIHEGQSCGQYQEQLQLRALQDAAAEQTQDMLQTLLQRGEAMHCPTCRIVVQKKDGCDWGPGDTSGGCRCNVNGQRCHPQCQNCH